MSYKNAIVNSAFHVISLSSNLFLKENSQTDSSNFLVFISFQSIFLSRLQNWELRILILHQIPGDCWPQCYHRLLSEWQVRHFPHFIGNDHCNKTQENWNKVMMTSGCLLSLVYSYWFLLYHGFHWPDCHHSAQYFHHTWSAKNLASNNLWVSESVSQSISQSVRQSVCLSVCLSVSQSVSNSISLSISQSTITSASRQ